jgi:hypothetical protein
MCDNCYTLYGRPLPDTEAHDAVPYIRAVADEDEFMGALHIVLDDWNLEDEHLHMCQTNLETSTERACATVFARMTVAQRAAALALYEGFIRETEE